MTTKDTHLRISNLGQVDMTFNWYGISAHGSYTPPKPKPKPEPKCKHPSDICPGHLLLYAPSSYELYPEWTSILLNLPSSPSIPSILNNVVVNNKKMYARQLDHLSPSNLNYLDNKASTS